MNRHEIEQGIRAFVIEAFLNEEQATELRNSDSLFDLLDSLQVLRLVLRLEPLFGVTVADEDLTAENLSSIERVTAFVAHKLET